MDILKLGAGIRSQIKSPQDGDFPPVMWGNFNWLACMFFLSSCCQSPDETPWKDSCVWKAFMELEASDFGKSLRDIAFMTLSHFVDIHVHWNRQYPTHYLSMTWTFIVILRLFPSERSSQVKQLHGTNLQTYGIATAHRFLYALLVHLDWKLWAALSSRKRQARNQVEGQIRPQFWIFYLQSRRFCLGENNLRETFNTRCLNQNQHKSLQLWDVHMSPKPHLIMTSTAKASWYEWLGTCDISPGAPWMESVAAAERLHICGKWAVDPEGWSS